MLFFFIDVCKMGACLCIFCLHSDDVMDANDKSHFFVSSFYWKLGCNTSLAKMPQIN